MNLKSKKVTIGLLWHSLASGNLGVGALTESNISIIKSIADKNNIKVNFLILGSGAFGIESLESELHSDGHSIECHVARVFNKSFLKLVRRCDFIVDIGEGDSFADIYGFKRFFYLWLSKNIAHLLSVPVILAPQTIGPFSNIFARLMAKQVMRRARKVFARDFLSKEYLDKIGIRSNALESIDVAFRLPFTKKQFEDNKATKFGLNISGLLFNGGYTQNNQFNLSINYRDTVIKLLEKLLELPQVEIHLISHVVDSQLTVEDDWSVAKELASKNSRLILAPVFNRPSEVKGYIAGMDFFVGGRMHACVAAFSSGVPVVPMAYSRKFNGLFGSLGYHRIADCKKDSEDEAIKKILEGLENREVLKDEIGKALQQVNSLLKKYEDVVQETLISTAK